MSSSSTSLSESGMIGLKLFGFGYAYYNFPGIDKNSIYNNYCSDVFHRNQSIFSAVQQALNPNQSKSNSGTSIFG